MPELIPIALIDDDVEVLESTRLVLLDANIKAQTFNATAAFLRAREASAFRDVRCIVTDIRMPGMTGIELQRELNRLGSKIPVILLTGHGDVGTAVAAMKSGAADFIEKPFDALVLIAAVRRAASLAVAAEQEAKAQLEIVERAAQLSARQHEVMLLVAEGHSNKQIAAKLGISPRTVETYRLWVMEKMGAGSVAVLVRMVMLLGSAPPARRTK
jgi:two-component system, LuxR family, response regulator FixJ